MTGGYMGRMLFVDLSQGRIWEETPDESLYRDFLGGYGVGARLLFQRQRAGVDPLGPDAILGFVTGPLTGTPAVISSRYVVVGKSPLTGTWGDANSGGDFGPYLKFAGYDAVFFTGVSQRPVYLYINNGKAELREANHLWGKCTDEVEDELRAELGKEIRVASIGPAGEKLSLISCIINDKGRAAARSGLGAVMGSKRLKAIVVTGQQAVPLAHKTQLQQGRKKYLEQIAKAGQGLRQGTGMGFVRSVTTGDSPVKNWSVAGIEAFPNAEEIAGPTVNTYMQKRYICWHCPLGCGGLMKAGTKYNYPAGAHRPEYETIAAFGGMNLNDDVHSIIMANDVCNRYGLDTISAGATISFAIECYQNGLVSDRDTGGIQLKWGDPQAIVAMTEKLAKREGFGDVLADGVKVAAERIGKGAEKFAVHVHGQEMSMHDPKARTGWTLGYLDAAPGRHTQSYLVLKPPVGLNLPAFDSNSPAGQGEATKMATCLGHVMQSAGVCLFGYILMGASSLPDFLNLVTGTERGVDDLLKIGERIANIREAFNIREGISASEINMPGRVIGRPPLQSGPTAGMTVDVETMRREYFLAMDWDPRSGKPSEAKLLELGMKDVARDLWAR